MKITWKGGPLDGAVDDSERMTPLNLWIGPDISAPLTKVIVYGLYTADDELEYRFDQHLTDQANERYSSFPGVASGAAGHTDPGGQRDGTGADRGDPGEDRRGGRTTGERDSGGA